MVKIKKFIGWLCISLSILITLVCLYLLLPIETFIVIIIISLIATLMFGGFSLIGK